MFPLFFLLLNSASGKEVSSEKAKKAGLHFLYLRSHFAPGRIKIWQKAKLKEPTIYYDLPGNKTTYCFEVEKKEKSLGYIMVSSHKEASPIQEFSLLPPPHQRYLTDCKDDLQKYLLSHKIKGDLEEPTFLYICPGIYFFKFSLSDNSGRRVLFVEMRSNTVIPQLKIFSYPGSGREDQSWNILEKPIFFLKSDYSSLTNFRSLPFFISSHPTSAAMILNYWNLRRADEPEKAFIGEIANYIATCGCGKKEEVLELAKGIKSFSALRGYQLKIKEYCKESTFKRERITFAEFKEEIEKKRPLLLCLTAAGNSSRNLSSAKRAPFITCVPALGYLIDKTGRYLIVQEESFMPASPISFYNWNNIANNFILITLQKPERIK